MGVEPIEQEIDALPGCGHGRQDRDPPTGAAAAGRGQIP